MFCVSIFQRLYLSHTFFFLLDINYTDDEFLEFNNIFYSGLRIIKASKKAQNNHVVM